MHFGTTKISSLTNIFTVKVLEEDETFQLSSIVLKENHQVHQAMPQTSNEPTSWASGIVQLIIFTYSAHPYTELNAPSVDAGGSKTTTRRVAQRKYHARCVTKGTPMKKQDTIWGSYCELTTTKHQFNDIQVFLNTLPLIMNLQKLKDTAKLGCPF